MEVKAVAVGKHHNMRGAPNVRHQPIVIFHYGFLSFIESVVILSSLSG
ncbi:hypothetical protein BN137_2993 [Cronobacter condimenti 1330]|uniref:Uncharacterized protein n=1 Tax=Cronobacter condimenti 1330 TaxID=1073999 RepID=K8ACY2_9ENTR|nr:hypothetical protein BN137_2993 [Cronobacter condimenti 1330]